MKRLMILGTIAFAPISMAQDAETDPTKAQGEQTNPTNQVENEASSKVEKIKVTGSHIRRLDTEGTSPITTITEEDIEISGVEALGDLLRNMPSNNFGSRREKTGGNFWGEANIDLRGLGAARTLVLLNGKRIAKQAGTGAVDLNAIPLAAVERIEILRDGASAIYGTDALGGVVNIITKKGFNGAAASARVSLPEEPGGESKTATFYQGTTSANGSTSTMITYNERNALSWNQRPDLIDRLSTRTFGGVGNYRDADGNWTPFPDCPESNILNGSCVAYYADESVVIPAVSTLGILSNFDYSISDDMEIFGSIWGIRKESKYNWGPYSATFQISQSAAAAMVAGTANEGLFDNHSGDVTLQFQTTDLGPETRQVEANMFGGGIGVRGYLGDYDWEVYITEDRSHKSDVQVNGAINKRAVTALMESGDFNPFATGAARGSLDEAEIAPFLLEENYSRELTAQITGPIYDLPSGTVEAAFGVIMFNEGFSAQNDPIVDRPEEDGRTFSGANFSGYEGSGSRNVKSAFFEASIPAYEGLEVQAAARMDSYSDFGTSVNPKVAFRYKPIADLYIRASAGTGFKAPTLDELYRSQYSQFVRYTDKVLCPVYDESNNDCRSKSTYIKAGGNPELEEEGSESFSYGFGYEIIEDLTLTADYWSILLKNAIGYQSLTSLTEAEQTGADLSAYAQITRDATTGEITNVVALNQNLGRKELKGFDYSIAYRLGTDFGLFRFKTHYSNLLSYKSKDWPAAELEEKAGQFGRPRWRNKSHIAWSYGPTTTTWTTLIIGPQNIEGAEIGDYNEHGLNVRYNASWDAKIGLGVQNIFDRPIPSNEDRLYSYLGRLLTVDYTQYF